MPLRLNFLSSRTSSYLFRSSQCPSSRTCDTPFRAYNPFPQHGHASISSSLSRSSNVRMNSASSGNKGSTQTPETQAEGDAVGPNQDTLPHVSEEAAQTARILGKKEECRVGDDVGGPELEQGTPVEEMLKRDKEAAKYAPKIMKQEMNLPKGSRSYSTSATMRQQDMQKIPQGNGDDASIAAVAEMVAAATPPEVEQENIGFKFDPPVRLPRTENVKRRYDPVIEQLTKLLMRDGKLALAQKHMEDILDHLRTAPPPQINPSRPLLPGPPPAQLPLSPVLYLTLIVDSVAPLLKIRQQKGAAGGGASLPIPTPLGLRQRRRTAFQWIIDASVKRRDNQVSQRVANELVAVAEGRSGVWDQRAQLHRQGVASRANVNWTPRKR